MEITYFVGPMANYHGEKEKRALGEIMTTFKGRVENDRVHRRDNETQFFDVLCDSTRLVIQQNHDNSLDLRMRHAMRICVCLHKKIFIIDRDFNILPLEFETEEYGDIHEGREMFRKC